MKAFKSAHADVKEKVQNAAAKVEEKSALSRASAAAKAEMKTADNKAAKHDAKANYHTKQAEILRDYEQKKVNNATEKEQTKTALHQKKADKRTDKADKHANATDATVGDRQTDENIEQTTTDPAMSDVREPTSEAQEEEMTGANTRNVNAPGGPTQEEFGDHNTSTPASSDVPEQVSEAREGDMGTTDSVDDAAPGAVDRNEVPMHGSGVPTHSTLHSDSASNPANDSHDARTTQTMGASPNNGSYM
ncbi:unnamed protein product [Calypogeia fissa]